MKRPTLHDKLMHLTIVESPYAANERNTVDRHIDYARACLRHSLQLGEAPFASHLLFTQPGLLDDLDPDQRQWGIAAGHAWYRGADRCAVYTDLGISAGMERGISRALAHGLKVFHRQLGWPV